MEKVTLFYTCITGLWGQGLHWRAGKLIWPLESKIGEKPVLICFVSYQDWQFWQDAVPGSTRLALTALPDCPCCCYKLLLYFCSFLRHPRLHEVFIGVTRIRWLDSEDLSSTQERETTVFIYVPKYPSWNHPHFYTEYGRCNAGSCALGKKEGGKQMVEGEIGSYGVSFRNL